MDYEKEINYLMDKVLELAKSQQGLTASVLTVAKLNTVDEIKDLTGQVIALRELTQRHEKEIKQLQISLAQTRHALAERVVHART